MLANIMVLYPPMALVSNSSNQPQAGIFLIIAAYMLPRDRPQAPVFAFLRLFGKPLGAGSDGLGIGAFGGRGPRNPAGETHQSEGSGLGGYL